LPGLPDLQQGADQGAVQKMELGSFDDLLPDIDMPGRQPMDNITCLQNRQPRSGGIVGYPGVTSQCREVDFLSCATGAELEKV